MTKRYPVIFTKEDVGYSTEVIDLEGCFSEGDDFAKAYVNTQEAIGLYLEGREYIQPSDPTEIILSSPETQLICFVDFDMAEYEKKHGGKSVRKTLTIPEWLNTIAEKNNVNFSKILKEALMDKLNM